MLDIYEELRNLKVDLLEAERIDYALCVLICQRKP
jgi:hypothetical protein